MSTQTTDWGWIARDADSRISEVVMVGRPGDKSPRFHRMVARPPLPFTHGYVPFPFYGFGVAFPFAVAAAFWTGFPLSPEVSDPEIPPENIPFVEGMGRFAVTNAIIVGVAIVMWVAYALAHRRARSSGIVVTHQTRGSADVFRIVENHLKLSELAADSPVKGRLDGVLDDHYTLVCNAAALVADEAGDGPDLATHTKTSAELIAKATDWVEARRIRDALPSIPEPEPVASAEHELKQIEADYSAQALRFHLSALDDETQADRLASSDMTKIHRQFGEDDG